MRENPTNAGLKINHAVDFCKRCASRLVLV